MQNDTRLGCLRKIGQILPPGRPAAPVARASRLPLLTLMMNLPMLSFRRCAAMIGLLPWACLFPANSWAADGPDFGREVLPILSDRCFHCHGPDESHREADLRLDVRESAVEDRGGYAAIRPGNPEESEVWARIISEDPDLRMPPADSHRKPLTPQERDILRRWILHDAPWGRHWAFEPPIQPEISDPDQHPIDFLVRRQLQKEGLDLAAPAPPLTLLRRVSLDLTGLPPAIDQVELFKKERGAGQGTAEQWGATVDRLLQSPQHAERMAMWWLDAARYSDTDGFQQDATRDNWPWRDWVVRSFHQNQPFDQFTIEQFAGDLLPNATDQQILATGFHRNHMTNGEGGRDPEESRVDYVIDRVNTTGTVWLGLTLGCAQCHSHKFDPISHTDYYRMSAFFNSIDEDGRAGRGAKPALDITSSDAPAIVEEATRIADARRLAASRAREEAMRAFPSWLKEQHREVRAGFDGWQPVHVTSADATEGSRLLPAANAVLVADSSDHFQDDYRISFRPEQTRVTGLRLEVFADASHRNGRFSRGGDGSFILTDIKLQVSQPGQSQVREVTLSGAVADAELSVKGRRYGRVADTLDDDPRNGWTTGTDGALSHQAVYALAEPLDLAPGEELTLVMLHRSTNGYANIGRFRLTTTDQPGRAVRTLDPMPLEQLSSWSKDSAPTPTPTDLPDNLRNLLTEQFLLGQKKYQAAVAAQQAADQQLREMKGEAGKQRVMVLGERKTPRKTHLLVRGVWDNRGTEVTPGVPEAVLPGPDGPEQTRLNLARWLVDRKNPLTARVIVNQLWQICFGTGLVRTPEDFGRQGEVPLHDETLDWLAVELMDSGWNIRHVLKLIVTSRTYQQDSRQTAALKERDPENRLLARGPRFRLPAWMIRDNLLAVSGLIYPQVGGPPMYPWQPPGVWNEIFMGRFRYRPSQGKLQFRRTLYAFWRRSSAPTFLFDSAGRRTCETRPRRTNTPLHALTLLNDVTTREAARELGRLALKSQDKPAGRIDTIFRRILIRAPSNEERQLLLAEYQAAEAYYTDHPADATLLLNFGQPEWIPREASPQHAALCVTAMLILNTDEAMTRE